jgi:hypothetical protein
MDETSQGPATGAAQAGSAAAVEDRAAGSLPPAEEALHIQAAAVAAQQGALTREEMRLEKQGRELELQQQQLADHFQQKLDRLAALREEARRAHATLQTDRAAYEKRVASVMQNLAADRRGLGEQDRQLRAERDHLRKLHGRLRRRWQRSWAGEHAALSRRETEVDRRTQAAQEERESLDRERRQLVPEQLRFSNESALGRRYLRSERERLLRLKSELDQREALLSETQTAQAEEGRRLAQEKEQWEADRASRVREAEGLETRIANYRSQLAELEKERELATTADLAAQGTVPISAAADLADKNPGSLSTAMAAERSAESSSEQPDEFKARLVDLERLAGDLGDQRRCLAEELLRFVQMREQWQGESQATATDLEELGQRLAAAELALTQREQAVQRAERAVQQKFEDLADAQKRLEGWKALAAVRAGMWEEERQRVSADLQTRQTLLADRLAALSRLGEKWQERRRRQVQALRGQRAACEGLRRRYTRLCEESSHRLIALAQQQRGLAERSLALDQYELEQIKSAVHPEAMERRLKELRRRSDALAAPALRSQDRERSRLEGETATLERRLQHLYEQEQQALALQTELTGKLSAWEKDEEKRQAEQARREHELNSLRQQRQQQDGQLQLLRGEVERLARLLFEGSGPSLPELGRAA